MLIVYLICDNKQTVGEQNARQSGLLSLLHFALRVVEICSDATMTSKHNLFSLGAVNDKLTNFCPSNNTPELLCKIRGKVLRAELRGIISVLSHDTDLTDKL